MPLYEYKCPWCQAETTDMRTIEQRENGSLCYRCGKKHMVLVISPVKGVVKNPAVPRGSK